jgi:nicotinamidase-related amidase
MRRDIAMADFGILPERTALVNVDMQNWFVSMAYHGVETLQRINRLADLCRAAGILVIHTRAVLRPDGSNMGVMGEMTPVVREGVINEGTETAALHRDLVVAASDVLVEKPRFGAFHGSDLEVVLRSRGIDSIIISGISTEACCDTTAREAHARDFRVLFLSDGTASAWHDREKAETVHQAALDVLGGLFAHVLTIDELIRNIGRPAQGARAN